MSKKEFLNDYVMVNERIEIFWKLYPNGRISTEILSHQDGMVIIKASVWKNKQDEHPDANGIAYEKEGSSFINNTSYIENCETSSIGRALGILGLEVRKSIASYEEVANAKLNQTSPSVHDSATEKQLSKLRMEISSKAKERNIPENQFTQALLKKINVASIEDLTKSQASQLIDFLVKG